MVSIAIFFKAKFDTLHQKLFLIFLKLRKPYNLHLINFKISDHQLIGRLRLTNEKHTDLLEHERHSAIESITTAALAIESTRTNDQLR